MVNEINRQQVAGQETSGPAPLRFGIFDWIDNNGAQPADLYEQRLQFLEYADTAGFYCYHMAEHQGTPLGMAPSPSVFLAAAAQRTRNIRLGPLVYPLPFYNPLRLLLEICMLDQMSRGRLEVGLGRGISSYELDFFNISVEESRAMFQEAMEIILMGLRTGKVSYEGKYYTFKDFQLPLKPWQKPYPPLWYPTANPDSIRWLASEGLSTISHYPPLEVMREHFDLYKQVWAEHKDNPERLNAHEPDPKYGITRHIYVADTDERALSEAKAGFADFIGNFNHLRILSGDDSGRADFLADFEGRLADGLHIVGSPATVRETLKEHIEATGSNYFVGSFFFGTLTTEQTLNSLRLFAEQVMPAFQPVA